MLRSKVASLEDEISRRKEETLQLESVVRERTAQMAALVGELELLQKVSVADDESVMKANTHNAMLEKQIERLGSDLGDQVRKGESLEARATQAEKKLHEFSLKLEHAEKTNADQRKKIQDLDDRLQHAQNKLSELENEAKLKAEELAKVHGMWLPHWLVVRAACYQELASAKWQVHGKPVLETLMQKVAEKSTYARELVEPYLQKAQNVAMADRSTATYRVCRDAVQPCVVKAQEFADHYWQECNKLAQPYITRIAAASEPYLSRASAALEPYMKRVTPAWKRLVSLTSKCHCQVQKGVSGFLESNELLSPLSADKLAWFTVSSSLAYVTPMPPVRHGLKLKLISGSHTCRRPRCSRCRCSPFTRSSRPLSGQYSFPVLTDMSCEAIAMQ
ncbi:hypothetical protein BAE44_0020534 [Dichanthelium oligosanthes]|uniref:Uncharacterized protein n=1 Tax=Dichanthelium oligosanthes TaxID=888268 RepID=A0A1E5UZX2_9POAL|nr:hypothetical protein BAE44_0020534 [Dichanthelium oligosanthes]